MESDPNYFRIKISSQNYFPLINKQNHRAQLIQRLKYCSISNEPLYKPIMMCRKGFFFNRNIVLEVIKLKILPSKFEHIKSENDLREIQIIFNSMRNSDFPLLCPLTNKVLNGSNLFVLNWECGCLLYEKLMFPLAGIKISMMTIDKIKKNDIKHQFNKQFNCPNCTHKFTLEKLFQLNIQKIQKSSEKSHLKQKIIQQELPPKLGKRDFMKSKNKKNNRFNKYLINLDINSNKIKRNLNLNLNFKSSFKKIKKDKKVSNKDSEIRVRYRSSNNDL